MNILVVLPSIFIFLITRRILLSNKYKPGTGRKEIVAVRQDYSKKFAIEKMLRQIGQEENCKFARAKFTGSYTTDENATFIYNRYEVEFWLYKEPEKTTEMYDLFGTSGFPM